MRRWVFIFILLGIFIYTAIAFISYQVTFPLIAPVTRMSNLKFYDYSGITHAHTTLSTGRAGSGTIDEVVSAASKAQCQFLILTDLNPQIKPEDVEGYQKDVLVIWGGEFSYLTGHLLAYNFKDSLRSPGQNQLLFNDLLQQPPRKSSEGFLVAAHPFLPHHAWVDLNLPGLSGMEIVNLDSVWNAQVARSKFSIFWSLLILPINPDLSYLRLFNEPVREIEAWDGILEKRQFVGYAGSDATANAIPLPEMSLKFPSYAQSFRLLKNHLLLRSELTGQFSEDRRKVIDALARGAFYFSVDVIGDPTGFYLTAHQGNQEFLPGDTLLLRRGPVVFTVDLGRDLTVAHEIVLFRNGERIATSNSSRLEFEASEPGAYRATVRVIPTLPLPEGKVWFTWIYSNAIRVD